MLSQYQYSIKYQKTSDHSNVDVLPVGLDAKFDGEEGDADMDRQDFQPSAEIDWSWDGVSQGPNHCQCDALQTRRMVAKGSN